MATCKVPFSVLNITNVDDFCTSLEKYLNYLEKATINELGDFTDEGKIINAGYNNYTIYWEWYKTLGYGNYQAQPYCAGFVSTQFATAFGLSIAKKLLYGDLYIFCPDGYNRFKSNNAIYSTPKKGDVVFFWSDSLHRWGHTGIVVGVDENQGGYTTIEANTTSGNDVVVRNGGATCRKHYTLSAKKVAFGRPPYEKYGIQLSAPTKKMVTYEIGTGVKGLKILAESIRIRKTPGTDNSNIVIGTKSYGECIFPTLKTFVNGDPWLYLPKDNGWTSGKYMEGWMLEKTCGNRWWYVENGYTYQTNAIKEIDGYPYFFDASGYMFTGTIQFTTDENGVLKPNDIE